MPVIINNDTKIVRFSGRTILYAHKVRAPVSVINHYVESPANNVLLIKTKTCGPFKYVHAKFLISTDAIDGIPIEQYLASYQLPHIHH